MHWHWLIVIYLFLGGLGAGAYLTSFAVEQGWLGDAPTLKRAGYFIAAPVVALGTILLVFDLGQGLAKPWLLIGLLANLRSVMTWGVYILSAFILVGLVRAYLAFKNKQAPVLLTWAGAILALATGAYTGMLLTDVQAIPFWNTGMMPVFFVVSALSTGLSATVLLAPFVEKDEIREGRAGQAHFLLIIIEIVVAAIFFWTMLHGSKGPVGVQSATVVVSGTYAFMFWVLFIGLGLGLPYVVYALQILREQHLAESTISAISETVLGNTGPLNDCCEQAASAEKMHHSPLMIVTDLGVLFGGFILRTLVIIAALPVWDGMLH
ncbi:NrfD/PsrC family molybdoenzyme membrane anchor subunit [Desulfosporosinus fructosivorans]